MIYLDHCKYDAFMLPIVECLKYYPLTITLSKIENVPLSLLSKAYSSALCVKEEQRIKFEIHNHTTSITKACFCSLLGLPQTEDMINPETVASVAPIELFYPMGYKETLTGILKFKKPNMPPQWNGLFTLLFNGFSERVIGSDCASKLFKAILYSLYIGSNLMDLFFGLK